MKFDLQAANIERAVGGWKVKVPLIISTNKYTNAQWYSTARGIHSAMTFSARIYWLLILLSDSLSLTVTLT